VLSAECPIYALSGNLLEREFRSVRTILRVLYRDRANVPVSVEIEQRVLVEIPRFGNPRRSELDIQGIRVRVVLDLHTFSAED